MALCSDLLVIAEDAPIGYPPAGVWGVPTSAPWAFRIGDQRAKRLLFTGDLIDGLERVALTPVNQLVMMKLLVNETLHSQGLHASQSLGVFLDARRRPGARRARSK